jgi:hypothetical protein
MLEIVNFSNLNKNKLDNQFLKVNRFLAFFALIADEKHLGLQ